MGDELAFIALIFRLKEVGTGAVAALLAVFAASRILMAPIAGSIVDHFPTRRLIASVSSAQVVIALGLAVAPIPAIYPLAFGLALGGSMIGPAWQSFVATVVPDGELSRTYAFIQSYRSIAIVIGAGLGGFLVDWFGITIALILNSVSFLFVAIVAATLNNQREPVRRPRHRGDVFKGFVLFIRDPILRWTLILLASFNMSAGVGEVLSPFYVTDDLGGSASDYGLMLGALGLSMFVTGAVFSRHRPPGRDASLLTISASLSAIGMIAYGIAPNVPVAIAGFVVNGIGLTGLHAFGTPLLIRRTLDEERGRMFAASSSVTTGGTLLATGIAAAIGSIIPSRGVVLSSAVACLVVSVVGGSKIRRLDRQVDVGVCQPVKT